MATEADDLGEEQPHATVHESKETTADDEVEVLEFMLADTRYCTEIEYVAEVVEMSDDALTRIPNSPPAVAGVMDLRGQTTTIVDPKQLYDVDDTRSADLIVVFDDEQVETADCMGWLVDDVIMVSHIDPELVDDPIDEDAGIQGIVNRESEFILWIDPEIELTLS